jgi:hypothetical protein
MNLKRIRNEKMKIQKFICFVKKKRCKIFLLRNPRYGILGSVYLHRPFKEEPRSQVRNVAGDLIDRWP